MLLGGGQVPKVDYLRIRTCQCQRFAIRGDGNLVDPAAITRQFGQLLAGFDVPAPHAAFHTSADQRLAVGRKPQVHAALLLVKLADSLAGLDIPHNDRLKGIARGKKVAVGGKGYGDDGPLMAFKLTDLLAGRGVAKVDDSVLTLAVDPGEHFAVGRDVDGSSAIEVPFVELLTGDRIPSNNLAGANRHQGLAIGAKGKEIWRLVVAIQPFGFLAALQVEKPDARLAAVQGVVAGGGQGQAVRRPGDGIEIDIFLGEDLQLPAARRLPDSESAVAAQRGQQLAIGRVNDPANTVAVPQASCAHAGDGAIWQRIAVAILSRRRRGQRHGGNQHKTDADTGEAGGMNRHELAPSVGRNRTVEVRCRAKHVRVAQLRPPQMRRDLRAIRVTERGGELQGGVWN